MWVLYLFSKSSKVRVARVDSEYNGKFFLHDGPKDLKLIFRQGELKLIVSLEKRIIGWDCGTVPFLLDLLVSALLRMELFSTFSHW